MNRLVISIGAITIIILLVLGIVIYMERTPAGTIPSSTATNGFQPLDQGQVGSSPLTPTEQAQPIPYATAPTPQPVYRQTIITYEPINFIQPFIQYVQPSPALTQQIAIRQNPPEIITPVPEPLPVQTPVAEPVVTSTPMVTPSLPPYIPYSGPVPAPVANTNGGGGDGGGGESTTGGVVGGLTGCLSGVLYMVYTGPIGVALGCLVGGLLGGLTGGGVVGGGLGSIIGGITSFGIGSILGMLGGGPELIDIQDVRGQTVSVLYEPGQSQLKDNHDISIGSTVLGNYGGITGSGNFGGRITNITSCSCGAEAGECLVTGSQTCTIKGTARGTINLIGTN